MRAYTDTYETIALHRQSLSNRNHAQREGANELESKLGHGFRRGQHWTGEMVQYSLTIVPSHERQEMLGVRIYHHQPQLGAL